MSRLSDAAVYAVNNGEKSFCKFLSANDTGLTGGHQAGIYVSKPSVPVIFNEPGVKGENGIDTFSLIKAISSFYNPDLIIVIDALVSTSLERLNKTIQLTDTGINLNGNYLDKKSLKVPVLAIGVPTVIDLKTLISTNIDMMVTPKEIDFIVDSLAYIISSSLNKVLHKI